ncbi:hypothetical protein KP509_37G037200 [Ceratopteris richardii]|uniref:Uncharacterized protein n=1 Tax=Ceratopteris richardii TaxID=49495 RepID=A0A8T2Q8A4_CERRI|nr:hypothetical protein KP509_37G037200 [Ceratopteris richardii]
MSCQRSSTSCSTVDSAKLIGLRFFCRRNTVQLKQAMTKVHERDVLNLLNY